MARHKSCNVSGTVMHLARELVQISQLSEQNPAWCPYDGGSLSQSVENKVGLPSSTR